MRILTHLSSAVTASMILLSAITGATASAQDTFPLSAKVQSFGTLLSSQRTESGFSLDSYIRSTTVRTFANGTKYVEFTFVLVFEDNTTILSVMTVTPNGVVTDTNFNYFLSHLEARPELAQAVAKSNNEDAKSNNEDAKSNNEDHLMGLDYHEDLCRTGANLILQGVSKKDQKMIDEGLRLVNSYCARPEL